MHHCFTLGTVAGDPANQLDNNRGLLYGWPTDAPEYSLTTIRVGGVNYRFGVDGTYVSGPTLVNGGYESVFDYGIIRVTQRLSFETFPGAAEARALAIQYTCENTSITGGQRAPTSATVGVRVLVDAHPGGMVSDIMCRINGVELGGIARLYQGANVPARFFTYDQWPNPTIITEGFLRDVLDVTRPDQVCVAQYGQLASPANWWNYVPAAGEPYNDIAVVLQYNEQVLAPGATRVVKTLYGAGTLLELTGQYLTWNPETHNLMWEDTDVPASTWVPLTVPAGAQIYIRVIPMGASGVAGQITHYDPDGGSHANAVALPATARNSLAFTWYMLGGGLYRLNQCSTLRALLRATYQSALGQTQVGRVWKPGPWKLYHAFQAPNVVTLGDQPFLLP